MQIKSVCNYGQQPCVVAPRCICDVKSVTPGVKIWHAKYNGGALHVVPGDCLVDISVVPCTWCLDMSS